jgi:3-dehydroquinate synthase
VQTLNVSLGARSYPIHVGEGLLQRAGQLLSPCSFRRAIVVSNPIVAEHHLDRLRTALAVASISSDAVLVPDGEKHKDWSTLYDIHTRLLELKAERSTALIALGGGVIGDLAGFAAATYQRGMPLVQVPTTLLAQVDSAVGGKTAVNHPLGKNMIGAFYQPRAVLSDTATLRTLPDREYRAGIAEVIKYGAIRDLALFEWLEENIEALVRRDPGATAHAVIESCRIKSEVVAADERETGERALLNFGHTFGHAIEAATGYGQWLHGEAVAAGMAVAARLSQAVSGLSEEEARRLRRLLERAGLPIRPPRLASDRWLEWIARDKKVDMGKLRFVLLERLGSAQLNAGIARERLLAVLAAEEPDPIRN